MQVLIYQDYIHNNGILWRRLSETFGAGHVNYADAQDIMDGALKAADLLVMPGGADLFNCEKLNGAGNAAIKTFVKNGGCYLGICAGAYYASAQIEWGKNTAQQITGARALNFFKGTAIGPIYDFLEDQDINKSWKNIVPVTAETQQTAFYEAGPIFTEAHNETVLARYDIEGTPAAIIACPIGKGLAILSSPHIEYSQSDISRITYHHRNPSYDWVSQLDGKDLPADNNLWQMVCTKFKEHRQV